LKPRKPIPRKTPLKPSGYLKRKKPINPMSRKQRTLKRKHSPARTAYKREFSICQCCGRKRSTDVHEIARGSAHREKAFTKPFTWLALCRDCHDLMGDYSIWPIAKQLALKSLVDPERFDLEAFNELRGDVTCAEDVFSYIEQLEITHGAN